MKKYYSLLISMVILAFNPAKAQFNSVTHCGANGVGHSIFFINPDTGYVAGENNGKGVIQKTMDGGNTWTNVYTSATSLEWVEDISFTNSMVGMGVGVNGAIVRTTDGGTSWNRQYAQNVNRFNTVCFPNSQVGYAAGAGKPNGIIYKTTDAGANWTAQISNADSTLQSIFFLNADSGYAVGEYDILKTTDGGTTWIKTNNVFPAWLLSDDLEHLEMYCTDANTCYIPYNGIKKTSDGGKTWNTLSLPAVSAPYVYYVTSINFTNSLIGYAVGALIDTVKGSYVGAIIKTMDAGKSWTNINSTANTDTLQNMGLASIRFVNAKIGYTTGNTGKVLKTSNAGGVTTGIVPVNEQLNGINMYPNPATTHFMIESHSAEKQLLNVFDVTGKLMHTQTIQNGMTIIDANNLAPGIYNVSIWGNERVVNKRLLIVR